MALARRSFVSTVLLSRTWETETVLELRKEAKARGLSTGNKSTLVARIKEHEQNTVSVQAAAPGIPLPAQPPPTQSDFLAIRLPKLSQEPPNAPVQVPFVPGFWNSAPPKEANPVELEPPKLHVVGGLSTHYDGGPTHNLEKPQEDDSPPTTAKPVDPPEVGFWADFWQSLGFPRSFSPRGTLSEAGSSERDEPPAHSRPLTDGERRGLYILLGIIGGSWLVGGLVNRKPVEHDTRKQH